MRIPTTEFCPQCEAETPKDVLAKAGRTQNRLFEDLDTGKLECSKGHVVELGPQLSQNEVLGIAKGLEDVVAGRTTSLEEVRAGLAPAQDTAIAVAEEPQVFHPQIVPGSSKTLQGGALELRLIVPEQYVGPLQSYCQGIGKTVEEFVNEVVSEGFSNGWFI